MFSNKQLLAIKRRARYKRDMSKKKELLENVLNISAYKSHNSTIIENISNQYLSRVHGF